jgi:hypothetical protein
MRIVVNDKPVEALTPRQESGFMLAKVLDDVRGTVLTAAEATETYIRQTRRWFTILGSIAFALMAAIAIAGIASDPREGGFIAIGVVIVGGAFLLFMFLLLRHRVRAWNARLAHRGEGLAPAGTEIALSPAGLAVGGDVHAWPSLEIDAVELTSGGLPSGDTSTTMMVIERLSVAAGPKTVVLDRALMRNGILLVDNCWRRLRAAAG